MSTREEKLTFRSPPPFELLPVNERLMSDSLCWFSSLSFLSMVLFFLLTIPFPVYPFATEFLSEISYRVLYTSQRRIYSCIHPSLFPPNLSDCVVTLNLFSVFSHHCLSLSILFVCFISLGRSDFFLLQCTRRISLSKSWVDVRARAATPISLSPLDLAAIER